MIHCANKDRLVKLLIALAVMFGILFMWSFWYVVMDTKEVESTHHDEVKSILKETNQKIENVDKKQEKTDKKVDRIYYDLHEGHKVFMKELMGNKRSIKSNENYYDGVYKALDTIAMPAVNDYVSRYLSQADSVEW